MLVHFLGESFVEIWDDAEYGLNGSMEQATIHAAVLLKSFLRSLGEPVITNRLYPELALLNGLLIFIIKNFKIFIFSGVSKNNRTEAVRKLVHKLPNENFLLLKYVIHFLTQVRF